MKRFLFFVAASIITFSTAYAAPVDIPSALKNVDDGSRISEEKPASFTLSGEGELLNKRDLRIGGETTDNPELEGQFYTGKGKISVDLLGKWDWYGFAGIGRELKLNGVNSGGNKFDLTFEDNVLQWGGGANYLLMYAPEYYGFGVFVDAKYRRLDNFDVDTVSVNGVQSTFTSNDDPSWQEWQGALGLAGKINYVIPFGGVTYSDTRVDADLTAGGNELDIEDSDTRNDDRVGAFAGVSLVPNDFVSFDFQARFIDEESYSASINLKF